MDSNNYSNAAFPITYNRILPRRNISKIMDSVTPNEIICLTAPYGCGKTHAVTAWLMESERQSVWLNLSEKDNSEAEFVLGLTAAMTQTDKKELFENPVYMENPTAFLREAVSRPPNPEDAKIIVVDNFHLISDARLLRIIKEFVSACFGLRRIIIISRIELPPLFNDLILKGHIRIITPTELNFNIQEITEYFIMNGCNVSSGEDIALIRDETEGWPAALNAIITVSLSGSGKYSETAREYIMTFFDIEIWSGLREDIKDFLLKTSVLDKLTPSACYAVTDIGAVLPILKWLFMNGMFISKLDGKNTYRYHRVFNDFLLNKLRESDIDEAQLHTKIAWWFFEKDDMPQSFRYFFKANDYYGINQVLKILNPAELGIEKYLETVSCITSLKAEDLKSYPILVTRAALIHFLTGNIDEMQKLSAIVHEWLESGELLITPEEYGEYIWEAGWLIYIDPEISATNNIDHEEWSNYHEYVPHIKPVHFQRHAVLGLPSALSGLRDYCGVVDTVDGFLKHNEETGRSVLRQEYAIYQTELINAEYSYEIEDYGKAEEIARKIMVLAESKLHIDLYFICTVILTKSMRAMNNTREIDTLINRLEAMIINNNHNFLLPNFHAFQLRNRLLDGQPGFTGIFVEENEKYSDKPYHYLIYRNITYARGLLSLNDYGEAMLVLGNLELLCKKHSRTMDLIEINILKAIALYGLGNEGSACDNLIEALQSSGKYGFIRIFSDNAKDIWRIIELVKKRLNTKYVQNIIISCKKSLSNTGYKFAEKKYSHIELTKTELNILKSLQTGMSYAEISLDCNISLATVKSHAHSIYSKLEVNNKTSAIIMAREQGLIE